MKIAALLPVLCLAIAAAAAAEVPGGDTRGRITQVDDAQLELWIRGRTRIPVARAEETLVTGRRNAWSELEAGDRVRVVWKASEDRGRSAHRVEVLQRAEEVPPPPSRASGWIHRLEGDSFVLRTLLGGTGRFARSDQTRVEGKRERWDALEQGDRVEVQFQRGKRPPEADRISVLVRAGEKPDPIRLNPGRQQDPSTEPPAEGEAGSELPANEAEPRAAPAEGNGG